MLDLNEGMASAAAAWQIGQDHSRQGDHRRAILWLDRAARLAPGDPRITLELANTRLSAGGTGQFELAATAFQTLAARYDIAAAWLGLLTARRLLRDHPGAADALSALLSRHCIPDDPAFPKIAAAIAKSAGFDGWSGVRPDGALHREGGGALGPPFDASALAAVEGVVSIADDALVGWASRPAAPAIPPALTLIDAGGKPIGLRCGNILPADETAPFATRHSFLVPAARLHGLVPPYRIVAAGGDLFGSPADPGAVAAISPVPASYQGAPVKTLPPRAKLAVVMPIYRDLAGTRAAFASLQAAAPAGTKIILVDDAAPDPQIGAWLETLSRKTLKIIRHAANRGFPAAANAGIAAAPGRDILLLNSDTLVPPGAIEALIDAAYAAAETGTATPFSNEATILSYPEPAGRNPMPDLAETTRLQRLAAAANGAATVDIPTAIGFCMFIRHDCLAAVGPFRGEIFAQGYGEENDFSMRARHCGFRHVAVPGAYVAHRGGVSFRAAGRGLNARNAAILNRLHPGYDELVAAWIAADPLAPARKKLDAARFAAGRNPAGAVLFISHDHGGGIARIVARDMAACAAAGRRPILLFPATPPDPKHTPFPWPAELTDDRPGDYPNLQFDLPAELPSLLALLGGETIHHAVLHHSLGLHPAARGIAAALGVPQDMVIHDYASFCPRVTLLTAAAKGEPQRYCGEPNLQGCTACVARLGDETFEGISPKTLVGRSAAEFAASRRITTPSADAAARIARHFPKIRPVVTPWEPMAALSLKPPRDGARRIAVIGGIGPAKGYEVLLDCARDAASRHLGLEFFIAGRSAKDEPLLDTGKIFITGPYREGEARGLIDSLDADLAFLPSIWPETWCFALSEAWAAGLYTIAFDLGAQATRIAASRGGALLPLGLPISRINDALLAWQPTPSR